MTPGEEKSAGNGALLIAPPELADPNFARTVVYIAARDEGGAFGLIVNRPLELDLENLATSLELSWGGSNPAPKVHLGGPVASGSLWLLHDNSRGIGISRRVTPEVSLTAEANALRAALIEPAGRYRFFLGYAGWGAGQLEAELAAGWWHLVPGSPDSLFAPETSTLWRDLLIENGIDVF